MWNKEGLEFYYTVEKHWREVYNDKVQFSVLINGWENWEPKDRSKKDALRSYWTKDEEEDIKLSSKKNRPQEKHWWEQEDEEYNTDRNLKAEYDWEDKTKRVIKERLGVVEEETDDDGVSESEGEKMTITKMMMNGKWWEKLSTNLRRRMLMTTKGTKNVIPLGGESRE